jgi:hypothetical protein
VLNFFFNVFYQWFSFANDMKAEDIQIQDAGGFYTATDVEGALYELAVAIEDADRVPFPRGTRALFANASAPPGWVVVALSPKNCLAAVNPTTPSVVDTYQDAVNHSHPAPGPAIFPTKPTPNYGTWKLVGGTVGYSKIDFGIFISNRVAIYDGLQESDPEFSYSFNRVTVTTSSVGSSSIKYITSIVCERP